MNRIIKARARLAAAAVFLLASSSVGMAQFHAVQDEDGNTTVLDTSGQVVDIAPADPVGIRPTYCPAGSFYVFEVQTDKTELVLTDCVTSSIQFTVEMQGSLAGAEAAAN